MNLDIFNSNSLVRNSCSIDLEWIPYSGIYSHDKTRLVAAGFCTHLGTKLILHISNFEKYPNPERELILAILRYLDKFSKNGTYKCGLDSDTEKCRDTVAYYGPCINNESFKNGGCKYRTPLNDYRTNNRGTREEEVFIDDDTLIYCENEYSQWSYLENIREKLRVWRPCEYYHQLNIALASSNAILNYSLFLALLTNRRKVLTQRDLLILDEYTD